MRGKRVIIADVEKHTPTAKCPFCGFVNLFCHRQDSYGIMTEQIKPIYVCTHQISCWRDSSKWIARFMKEAKQ